jgi:hypothetical protein
MKKFAVIQNNIVLNIILADSKEIAEQVTDLECIEYTDESPAKINDTWDGTNFISPIVEEPTE